MICLFIGGAEDGRRIDVPDGETRVRVPRIDQGLSETLYRRERLASPSQQYVVFVEDTLTLDEAMRALIDNYHPQAETAQRHTYFCGLGGEHSGVCRRSR